MNNQSYVSMNYVLFEDELRAYKNKPNNVQLGRILNSPKSEDLLSWNLFYPISRLEHKKEFLHDFFRVCLGDDFEPASFDDQDLDAADIVLWQQYSAPEEREKHLDDRLGNSGIKLFRERHEKGQRFEGATEVDVSITTKRFVAFVEAKYFSDISSQTSYDLTRDQMTRNLDVGFHFARERGQDFYFVLLTIDRFERQRLFWYKWQDYKTNPQYIRDNIPYIGGEDAEKISKNIGWLLWKDVFALFKKTEFPDDISKRIDFEKLVKDFLEKGVI